MVEGVLAEVRRLIETRRHRAARRWLAELDRADHPMVSRLAGMAELGLRNPDAARRHLRRALVLAPDDLDTLFQLGHADLAASEPLRAAAVFERLAAVAPGTPGLEEALAGVFRRDARYHDALRVTDAALTRGNRSADILYERAVSLAHLGDAAGALAVFDERLRDDPEHAAAWFGSHAVALGLNGAEDALRRLRHAIARPGANGKYWAYLAATLLLLDRGEEARTVIADHIAGDPRRLPLVESVEAVLAHRAPGSRLFGVSAEVLRHALAAATVPGMVLEFGVRRGTSINQIAEAVPEDTVHGFDSFEGLPEAWVNEPRGVLTTGHQLPPVRPNVRLHAGWFEDTLPPFLEAHPDPVRFVNVDSDIYSSARTVLTALAPRLRPGAVLVFDEFIGNRTWRDDEYRAFQEFAHDRGASWEVIAVSPFTKQVAIRLLGLDGG